MVFLLQEKTIGGNGSPPTPPEKKTERRSELSTVKYVKVIRVVHGQSGRSSREKRKSTLKTLFVFLWFVKEQGNQGSPLRKMKQFREKETDLLVERTMGVSGDETVEAREVPEAALMLERWRRARE